MAPVNKIDALHGLLRGCNRCVIFTGAGIRTESGIPDDPVVELQGNAADMALNREIGVTLSAL